MSPPAGSRPKTLTFITSNANKLAEVKAILLSHSNPADTTESSASQQARDAKVELELELKSQSLELVEIQAGSVEEVARDKCVRAAEMVRVFFYLVLVSFLGYFFLLSFFGG